MPSLTQDDIRILQGLIDREKRAVSNAPLRGREPNIDHQEMPATEVYVARAPIEGIPGYSGENGTGTDDDLNYADCQIYQLLRDAGYLEAVDGLTKRVYNISTNAVGGYSWILIKKDKFGIWWVEADDTVGTGGISDDPWVTGTLASGATAGHIRAEQEPSGSVPGNTRGEGAVEWQQYRNAADKIASGTFSTISGGARNKSSGYYATVAGGFGNTSSNDYSVASGGIGNVSSGDTATIGGGGSNTASGYESTIGGGGNNLVSAFYATVSGGHTNQATAMGATISGGETNTVNRARSTVGGGELNTITSSGTHSTIGGGYLNDITNEYATVGGGSNNDVSGAYGSILGGQGNQVTATRASIIGGGGNIASGASSVAFGEDANSRLSGMLAQGCDAITNNGDSQNIAVVLRCSTTNSTPGVLNVNGGVDFTVPIGKAIAGIINVLGIKSDGSNCAHYIRKFAIKNIGGTTSLIGSVSTIGTDHEDDAAYDITVIADNSLDSLAVTVTGKSGETIRWMGYVNAVEMEYGA